MNKAKLKKVFNIVFLVAVFAFTLWSVFRGEDLKEVLFYLKSANDWFLIPSLVCVVAFILGESVVIYYMLRTLGTTVKFFHCCLYSFIGFFYSCITPSASGGQPMQVVYMRKDGIPTAVSTVVLAIVTITYKLVLVLIGAAVLLLRPESLMVYLEPVEEIIYLGMILNVVCIAGLLLLVFWPGLVKSLAGWAMSLLTRLRLLRNSEKLSNRLANVLSQYEGTAQYFRTHKGVIVRVFLITFVQRWLLFLITWFIYCSFSLSGHSLPLVTTLQAMISVASDMLPLPGGMGVSENLFLDIFHGIFGEDLLLPGMVLSRGISYYTQLLISGIMTLTAMFLLEKKKKKGREKKCSD